MDRSRALWRRRGDPIGEVDFPAGNLGPCAAKCGKEIGKSEIMIPRFIVCSAMGGFMQCVNRSHSCRFASNFEADDQGSQIFFFTRPKDGLPRGLQQLCMVRHRTGLPGFVLAHFKIHLHYPSNFPRPITMRRAWHWRPG